MWRLSGCQRALTLPMRINIFPQMEHELYIALKTQVQEPLSSQSCVLRGLLTLDIMIRNLQVRPTCSPYTSSSMFSHKEPFTPSASVKRNDAKKMTQGKGHGVRVWPGEQHQAFQRLESWKSRAISKSHLDIAKG